jgi:hypothetical protein
MTFSPSHCIIANNNNIIKSFPSNLKFSFLVQKYFKKKKAYGSLFIILDRAKSLPQIGAGRHTTRIRCLHQVPRR